MSIVAIEKETGELLYEIEEGSSIITPAERERRRSKREQRIDRKTPSGVHYVFSRSAQGSYDPLPPATMAKLVYLSTFLNYEGKLVHGITPIRRRELAGILGISPTSVYYFWRDVNPLYVYEQADESIQDQKDEVLFMNPEYFYRGNLDRKHFTPYQKLFCKGIQSLYKSVPTSKHRQLGYLFKLLPYVNREWNVLCTPESVYEKDLDNIRTMSIEEFCQISGYTNTSNISKLKDVYDSLYFDMDGQQQKFCSFVYKSIKDATARIVINPAVFYAGGDRNKVEVYKLFFKD